MVKRANGSPTAPLNEFGSMHESESFKEGMKHLVLILYNTCITEPCP